MVLIGLLNCSQLKICFSMSESSYGLRIEFPKHKRYFEVIVPNSMYQKKKNVRCCVVNNKSANCRTQTWAQQHSNCSLPIKFKSESVLLLLSSLCVHVPQFPLLLLNDGMCTVLMDSCHDIATKCLASYSLQMSEKMWADDVSMSQPKKQ